MTTINRKLTLAGSTYFLSIVLFSHMLTLSASTVWADESFEKKSCVLDYFRLRISMYVDGFKKRDIKERNPSFLSDLEYLEEKKALAGLGVVATEFDPKFKTRVHFTATAKPLEDGTIPRVDPAARANYIYFHGSGTMAAGGNTFSGKQNSLAGLGYNSIGFDYPWHKDGNVSREMLNLDKFTDYLHEFIQAHRVPGQPTYLVGHSFGPSVIKAYVRRHPKGADGAVWLSGPMDDAPELEEWSQNQLKQMQAFWTDTKSNEKGGTWAGIITRQAEQDAEKFPDPTDNPDFKLRVLIGQDEEYIPRDLQHLDEKGMPKKGTPLSFDFCAWVKKQFKNAICTVEPGVGHMIFAHRDAEGSDIILRELAAINGDDIRNAKEMKKSLPQRVEIDIFAQKYRLEPLFKKWLDAKAGPVGYLTMLKERDMKAIKALQTEWKSVIENRNLSLMKNIQATEQWAPEFYAEHKAEIDALDLSKPHTADVSAIVSTYREFLKTVRAEDREKYAVTDTSVFIVPEKTPKPPKEGKQQKGEKPVVTEKAPAGEKPAEEQKSAAEQKPDSHGRAPASEMPATETPVPAHHSSGAYDMFMNLFRSSTDLSP
ncbi:MAG: alpha/beta fold hydrolase [Bdellovibrionia bacterium]